MRQWIILLTILGLAMSGCNPSSAGQSASAVSTAAAPVTAPLTPPNIPNFDHILVIVFENHSYQQVIGVDDAPTFNQLASQNTLLTNYHAVTHPSLPNYIALLGGDTFGIHSDCTNCFIDQASLPDRIEAGGRTWKTYQEDLPAPCFVGNQGDYAQKHNPAIYFDPIRSDAARCARSIVPLAQLEADLSANRLPDFAFISPNLCHAGHDCKISTADAWLKALIEKLQASPALGSKSLIVVTFDEGELDNASCCGLGNSAGGRVAAILISPLAKNGFQDATPLSHYSLLKTILLAWNLPDLGFTSNPATAPITAPWK